MNDQEWIYALHFYSKHRWKYGNFGRWNKEFGQKLSASMMNEIGDKKCKYWSKGKRKDHNCKKINSILEYLCREIRICLGIRGNNVKKIWNNVCISSFFACVGQKNLKQCEFAFFLHRSIQYGMNLQYNVIKMEMHCKNGMLS